MIRVISFYKAFVAGAVGALAWEVFARALTIFGWPAVDLVKVLGTLIAPALSAWLWWPIGLVLHVSIGVIGAIFYAYFFYSRFSWPPAVQGMAFGLIAAVPVYEAVYPLLLVMHASTQVAHMNLMDYGHMLSRSEGVSLILGHLIYGGVLGALYIRPVGRSTAKPSKSYVGNTARAPRETSVQAPRENQFMFATGIECSYPTIDGGQWRLDQMEATGHYKHWRHDFALTAETGITHLRYGPPLHRIYKRLGHFDWSFTDVAMMEMQRLGIVPIIDLCHFGVPDWLENFQNPELPSALTAYASAFAQRYPWVRYYTPVNEMYVCAKLSTLEGVWNEQRRDERSFMTAVRHMAKANVQMMHALLAARPDAVFVNSESGEFYQACCPDPEVVRRADFENERRFLALDLIYGRPLADFMLKHAFENGLTSDEYAWFLAQQRPRRAVLGVDYYLWNEKLINSEGNAQSLGELFGWYVIAQQYYERYRLPMMHTETNILDARKGPYWLWRQWHNVKLIQAAGVPVVGFTWYSLTDQVDWDIGMSKALGTVNPVGLFDLNRDPRPVGQAYKHLIRMFSDEPWVRDCGALRQLLT